MRKILVLIAGAAVALVFAAVLVLPAAVDWNAYKPEIARRLQHALGRDVEISGDLKLSLLPRPELTAEQVRIGPPKTGVAVDLAGLESLRLRLALLPLLRGRAHVEELVLVAPIVRLALPAATPEPAVAPEPAAAPALQQPPADVGGDVILDRLVVQDGTLLLRKGEATFAELSGVEGHLSSGGAAGPFRAEGSFSWRGARASLTAATGDMAAPSAPVSLVVRSADPSVEAKLSGQVERGGDDRRFRGKLAVSGGDLPAAARRFLAIPLPAAAAGPFALDAQVKADTEHFVIEAASLRGGGTQAGGGASITLDGSDRGTLSLTMSSLDLDRWLVAPAPAGGIQAPAAPPIATPDFALPDGLDVALDIGADAVVYRGAILRQARLEGALNRDGVLAVRRATAQLPGASQVTLSGRLRAADGRPVVDAGFEAASDNLRAVLAWLGIDVTAVPADRLRLFAASGTASGNPQELHLRDLDVSLDRSRLSGALTVRPGQRLAVGANLAIDSLNLDAYFPPAPAPSAVPQVTAPSAPQPQESRLIALLTGFDANVRTHIDELTLNEVTLRSVDVDGTLFGGDLTLRNAAIGDAEGTAARVSGTITGLGGDALTVRGLAYELRSQKPDNIFRLLASTPPFPAERLGSVAMTGTVDGGADGLSIAARAEAGGAVATLSGRIRAPLSQPQWEFALEASHASFAEVVRLFDPDYRSAGRLGAFALSTRLAGDRNELTLSDLRAQAGPTSIAGEARVVLSDKPRVEAQLQTGEIDVDALLPGRRTAALPAGDHAIVPVALISAAEAAAPAEWSRAPLDLRWLQSLDGVLTVNSRAVTWHDFRIDDAVLAAGLSDGVLTVHRFGGPMFDGGFDLTAHLAANGSAALQFEITDAHMRNAQIKIAGVQIAGGRLNAQARIESEGRSRFEMASRLRGEGRIDSRDGVIRGFNLGGVSQRLGNLDKIEDVLGLLQVSMASSGSTPYSSLTGTFKAANGVASTDDLRLDAEGGTAQGVATANLPAYTVDGRVVFRLTDHPKAPAFVMLVQGPLDSPRRSFDSRELQSWLLAKVGSKAGKLVEDALAGREKGGIGKLLEGLRKELGR